MDLYTIGHSNHPIDEFTQLLLDHEIACLVDVRSTPYSRFHPQFNRAALQQALQKRGIEYLSLGAELGGRPRDPSCYTHHIIPTKADNTLQEVDYNQVMQRPWFIHGIDHLLELAAEQPCCILCSEKDPARCHRHQLIASYLVFHHPQVRLLHILGDGSTINARSLPMISDKPGTEQLSF